jgi:hypothetical protein
MNGSFLPSRPICYSEREKKAQTMRHKKPSRGSNSSNGIKSSLAFLIPCILALSFLED